jgi:hypothetical protein
MEKYTTTIQPQGRKNEHVIDTKGEMKEGPARTPFKARRPERLPQGARRATRTSDVAPTKSISKAANNPAASWTIGSKPNANSDMDCLRARRRAKKHDIVDRQHPWLKDER